MLSVDRVSVSYGAIVAVRDVSLHLSPGEIVALAGRNGAGKTTTLRAMAGELPIRKGQVLMDGAPLRGSPWSRAKSGIRLVPEGHRVFGRLLVVQNLAVAREAARKSRTTALELRDEEIFDLFPRLRDRQRTRAGMLSGGEQQMLAIAMGLLAKPRFLLIDELSLGLAPGIADDLAIIIRKIASIGVGVLLVEQDHERTRAVADRVVVMKVGETVWEGPSIDYDVAAMQLEI